MSNLTQFVGGEWNDLLNKPAVIAAGANQAEARDAIAAAPASHVGGGDSAHALASSGSHGFMSSTDKTKLDGIETGAQVNTVASVAGKTGAVTLVTADVAGLDTALANKQATLVSGTNIKTVGGQSLLGSGNVPTGEPLPTATTISRTGGVITSITETVGGTSRVTTITRSDGVVTQIAVAHNGTTRTETLNRINGQVTGITVTET